MSLATRAPASLPALAPADDPHGIGRGLFDFERYEDLVQEISVVLGLDPAEVARRLFCEAARTGWNVSEAARGFGVTPHVYDARMQAFYGSTDAFVFELAAIHCDRGCQEIDGRVAAELAGRFPDRAATRVLALGDGIGTDSLRLAHAGFDVTYFEFEGPSAALARRRFERLGVCDRVTQVHDLASIPRGAFDAAVNREVLEHVPDPVAVVESIRDYLAPGGIAIVTESFARVEPEFPTHLRSNLAYAGRTPHLFVEAGFRLERVHPGGRPMVFSRAELDDRTRFRSLRALRPPLPRRLLRRLAALIGVR